ncbi:hypothetical protein C9I98_20745 [Photobacterium sanctipauli]|uniref:Uncharacterized protein n=2 Tax=Photobacterium sanctipauli TaxID=1342794 RepID=A0A2T3NIR1_9GAMM|nr:hypothetical protein C9I98_20745 [Photobacterium sanctipauli]
MVDCRGELTVEVGGQVAHVSARGRHFVVELSQATMLWQFWHLYRQLPLPSSLISLRPFSDLEFTFAVSSLASIVVKPRQGWLCGLFPLRFSFNNKRYWLKILPSLLWAGLKR